MLSWELWGSYYGSALTSLTLGALIAHFILRRPLGDSAIIGFSGGFSNLVLLGLPITLTYFGNEALSPFFLILAVHSIIMYSVSTFLVEIARVKRTGTTQNTNPKIIRIIWAGLQGMVRNVIILSLVLGIIWSQTGFELHDVIKSFLNLLGRAGIPAALFVMGAMLTQYKLHHSLGAASFISLFKLVVHPLIAFMLARYVFALPTLWVGTITLMASMLTGIFTFLLANRYPMAQGGASSAIGFSTLLSMVSIIIVLGLLTP
ncbi:MAG: AEC family transporter [Parvularculales bacterium]